MAGQELGHNASLELFTDIRRRLAKAVLLFQDKFVDLRVDSGSLVQVWLPEGLGEGQTVLRTKGLPFCVAGAGDLLALFRCISCRFRFATNISQTNLLGAPGRVFSTGVAEMSRNVQQYSKEVYLRASEAQQCQIRSTIVLPLFDSPARGHAVGVLEVVQTSNDMPFAYVISTLDTILRDCQLWTCKPDMLCSREMSESSDTVRAIAEQSKSPQTSGEVSWSPSQRTAEANCSTAGASPQVSVNKDHQQQQQQQQQRCQQKEQQPVLLALPDPPVALTQPNGLTGSQQAPAALPSPFERMSISLDQGPPASSALNASSTLLDRMSAQGSKAAVAPAKIEVMDDALDDGSDLEDGEGMMGADDDEQLTTGGARRGKGTGNPGKPGKRLRLADLQGQFGVGLKEAANRLGICPTTLKRACRRHGIQRWPRRQLLKLSKAIDQINATTHTDQETEEGAAGQQAPVSKPEEEGGNFGDGRWTQLAQLIPGLHAQLQDNPAQHVTESTTVADTGQLHGRRQDHDPAQPSSMPLAAMHELHLDHTDPFDDSGNIFGASHAPHIGQMLAEAPCEDIHCMGQANASKQVTSAHAPHPEQMHTSMPLWSNNIQVPANGFVQQARLDWQDELLAPYNLPFPSTPQHSLQDFAVAAKGIHPDHLRDTSSTTHTHSHQHNRGFAEMHKLKPSSGTVARGDSLGADDLHDDVGIMDQSVLDLLLETPA